MNIVLPGDTVKQDQTLEHDTLKVGPGLLQQDTEIVAIKAGILNNPEGSNKIWIENRQKRYVPATGDSVVGIVIQKGAENYRVDIGGPHPAVLSVLAFEGATRRNRPILEVGSHVYARVSFAHRDIEPELECINPTTGKAGGYGELGIGHCFKCSLSLARNLMHPHNPVLTALSSLFPFETAIGLNGRVWINAETRQQIILVRNAIRNSEFLTKDQVKPMIKSIAKVLED